MLILNEDGTHTAGPLDAMCILQNMVTKRYHVTFFDEVPLPGPILDVIETPLVRLKSNMHHTEGADTIEGAKLQLAELRQQITMTDDNVTDEPIPWNGELGIVWLVLNWKAKGQNVREAIFADHPTAQPATSR